MGGPGRFSRPYRSAFYFLTGLFLALNLGGVDHSCLDAADSAYLISADAIAGGLIPYRDFLAAHPPLLYVAGAPLSWFGAGVIPFRVFSLLVLACLGLAVWKLALRLTGRDDIAFLAGAFTLFAPLGIYFSKLFIQDSLVALLAVASMALLLGQGRRRLAAAGLLCILALLTKLTFLPLLLVFILYVHRFRRPELGLFLELTLGGSLLAVLALELLTAGAYLDDIILAQASKGYSFANFHEGLLRIWQIDWPLLVAAAPGLWFAVDFLRRRHAPGGLLLLLGWLAAGAAVLLTLFADGHDTNLYLLVEPALALLAAWGIMGPAGRGRPAAALAMALLLVSVVGMVSKDRVLINRSNAGDVAVIADTIESASAPGEASLVPGCYALEADRPVARRFFDQFLWEEKYRRGEEDAQRLFSGIEQDISRRAYPVVVFEEDRASLEILDGALADSYRRTYDSRRWPPVGLWTPKPAQDGSSSSVVVLENPVGGSSTGDCLL